jgi:heme a synthase
MDQFRAYRRYSWFALAFCLLVICWGALVRATGSGAGCGSHWPLCNGQVIPLEPTLKTFIEYFHRITAGVVILLVLGQFLWSRKLFAKGSFPRSAAWHAWVAMVIEALIGAMIVVLGHVEHDRSYDRVVSISLHLLNTLYLVAAQTLAAWSPGVKNARWRWPPSVDRNWKRLVIIGFTFLGMFGAMTALGDTLFPVNSLQQEWREKFDPELRRHFLQQIRIIHPLLAVIWAGLFWYWAAGVWSLHQALRPAGYWATGLVAGNLAFGLLNVIFLAPVWMQLVHLLWAQLIWIAVITFLFRAGQCLYSESNLVGKEV